ncbi:hypothetical protein DL766_000553 [Monosporascus sp. MC13-8B]|uniref:VWFA domain-containing protein n=1 Tax=Monosporascus cannonballus TaxID=155416 RepID=A0ABY0H6F8_9PEZI|nr:hypothetical protein DL762_004899 [Monosporascus cannonballus]RYP39183.1 hypothetical protein DL766_000553 [Monosporascus sp. MC13-8B]
MVKKEEDQDKRSIISTSTLVPDGPTLTIHPLATQDGAIVRVEPPRSPSNPSISHVPCDVVLVIDVSGSMSSEAPAPTLDSDGKSSLEDFGLSILDLTKHAARTVLETLDEGDRMGIVTFSTDVRVVQPLLPMDNGGKELARSNIESMKHDRSTNLWGGITAGLKLFENNTDTGRVPAVMVLTDGKPNYMCPRRGYVPKLREMSPLPATIHTFGFGYTIRSGLLKSIAEIGGGNYAFIPDAGMIGTVFIHAVAHLQSTYATKCTLELTTPKSIRFRTTVEKTVHEEVVTIGKCNKLTIDLGNLQYGQSRDIYLGNVNGEGQGVAFDSSKRGLPVSADLTYSLMQAPSYVELATQDLLIPSELPSADIAYHKSRSMICDFFASCFELKTDGEYGTPKNLDLKQFVAALRKLVAEIPAQHFCDRRNQSIMQDLVGESPAGQVSLALSRKEYFDRWGRHYFLSLWSAHAKQLCNSFKDPGPLMYNDDSPLFARCRDALDRTFDDLPPPKPTYVPRPRPNHVQEGPVSAPVSMRSYRSPMVPCFSASSSVLLSGGQEVPVCKLSEGASVQTPVGDRRVVAVLRTPVRRALMCRVGELLVTPWHPIVNGDGRWVFPADVTAKRVRYSGAVYSVLLQKDSNVASHAVRVGGVWGVTLGHSLVTGSDDVRVHPFFGDYAKVLKSLKSLGPGRNGVRTCGGVRREVIGGLICGFRSAHGARVPRP